MSDEQKNYAKDHGSTVESALTAALENLQIMRRRGELLPYPTMLIKRQINSAIRRHSCADANVALTK